MAVLNLHGQGLVFDDKAFDEANIKPHLMRGEGYKLPVKFSLKEYCPPPGNQLDYSTSVGWAIAWSAKTILYARNNGLKDVESIKPYIFAPTYIYQKALKDTLDCSNGISLEAGLKAIKEYGTPKLEDFLFFCKGEITPELEKKASTNKISGYTKLFNRNDKPELKRESIKKSLSEGYPVIAGMISTPSFKRAKEFWQPVELPDSKFEGQAVCIIGYDDNKYGGAFEIINSWGKSWGNDGFMWIRYDDFNDYIKYAYEVFDFPKQNTKIAGSVEFEMDSGEEMPVEMVDEGYFKMKHQYKGGDAFRIFINNEDPGFLYVFGSDLTNAFFPIFPHEETISAALNYRLSKIAIPDENSLIKFDQTAGTDYLCILYSREELDIDRIMNSMKEASGDFNNKMRQVLNPSLLNKEMSWSEDKVAFAGDAKNGNVVAVIVEFSHY